MCIYIVQRAALNIVRANLLVDLNENRYFGEGVDRTTCLNDGCFHVVIYRCMVIGRQRRGAISGTSDGVYRQEVVSVWTSGVHESLFRFCRNRRVCWFREFRYGRTPNAVRDLR